MNLEEIKVRYSEPHRFYHTWDHIEYMFRIARDNGVLINPDSPLWFAIVYHDIIYDPKCYNNEERSGQLAVDRNQDWKMNFEHVRNLILVTKTHLINNELVEKDIQATLIDLDLAILGDTPEVYQDYVIKVQKEYAHATGEEWREGRSKWIRSMLKKDSIFYTEWGRKLEKQARENLRYELHNISLTSVAWKIIKEQKIN